MQVLLVEDNPRSREVIKPMLRASGLDVQTTDSTPNAIIRIHRHKKFDMVLIDQSLPVQNGEALAAVIRNYD
jgi:CheY-like chemotaxis protein